MKLIFAYFLELKATSFIKLLHMRHYRAALDTQLKKILSTLFHIHHLTDAPYWLMSLRLAGELKYAMPPTQRAWSC